LDSGAPSRNGGLFIEAFKKGNRVKCKFDLVIFDLNGTLVDSRDSFRVIERALFLREEFKKYNLPLPDFKRIDATKEMNMRDMIVALLPENHRKNEGIVEEMIKLHDTVASEFNDNVKLMPGAMGLIVFLTHNGVKIGLATNGNIAPSFAVLKNNRADEFISVFACATNVPTPKPAPNMLNHVLKVLGIPKEKVLFIGDTHMDRKAGKAAGIETKIIGEDFQKIEELYPVIVENWIWGKK
jgi:HAD superfamily hydrolase (TIGR01509 family)